MKVSRGSWKRGVGIATIKKHCLDIWRFLINKNGLKRLWWTLMNDRRLGALKTEPKQGNHLR